MFPPPPGLRPYLTLPSDLLQEAEHRASADLSFSSLNILVPDSLVTKCQHTPRKWLP